MTILNQDTPQLEDVTFNEMLKEYMIDEIERLPNDGGDEHWFAQQFDRALPLTSAYEEVLSLPYSYIDIMS